MAPVGIVIVIDVVLQEFTVSGASCSSSVPVPCDAPNFEPLITTLVPTGPVVAESPEITGGVRRVGGHCDVVKYGRLQAAVATAIGTHGQTNVNGL
jgi:hypothetical protein